MNKINNIEEIINSLEDIQTDTNKKGALIPTDTDDLCDRLERVKELVESDECITTECRDVLAEKINVILDTLEEKWTPDDVDNLIEDALEYCDEVEDAEDEDDYDNDEEDSEEDM